MSPPIGSARAGIVSQVDAIPDSDLTQYQETDADNEIVVDSSTQYTGTFSDGANSDGRLYRDITLSDFSPITYTFDLNVSNHADNADINIGWSTDSDSTRSVSGCYGCSIGTNQGVSTGLNFMLLEGADNDQTTITTISTGTDYSVEIAYDADAGTFTTTLFDSGGSELGSELGSIPSGLTAHYAAMGSGMSLETPGSIDLTISNVAFE